MDDSFHSFERSIDEWHFWYAVRREILAQYLDRVKLPASHPRLLDLGCGTGGSSLVLARYGEVVGLDRSMTPFKLSMDRPYAHRVLADIERLPFADGSFDAVAALDVLEHLDDDIAGAKEVYRVLKPGGAAVVFVPAFQILWGRNDVVSHHRRRYRKDTLRKTLEAAGFTVEHLGYFNLLLFAPTLAVRLLERVFPAVSHRIEYQQSPTRTNALLTALFRLELPLLRHHPLPLGTSVCCLARR